MRGFLPLLLFVVVIFVLYLITYGGIRVENTVAQEAALTWTMRAVGGVLAATAVFALLLGVLVNVPVERQVATVLPLLGGMLLVTTHWSLAVALAIVAVALIIAKQFPRPAAPPDERFTPM